MCFLQRLLLLLQDKDKELEELLQEIQCEKVPSPAVASPSRPVELRGWSMLWNWSRGFKFWLCHFLHLSKGSSKDSIRAL